MADLSQLIHEAVAHAMERHAKSDPDTPFILHEVLIKMSALSDAIAANNAAVAQVQTSVSNAITKIEQITLPSDAADVSAAVTALGTSTSTLTTAAAALDAANPPAPAS